jgi:hypothetical protein
VTTKIQYSSHPNEHQGRSKGWPFYLKAKFNTLKKGNAMRLIIALLMPFVLFFIIRRPILGIVCLVLQATLIGWLPAVVLALIALSQYKTDQKIMQAMNSHPAPCQC